jgi:alpha-tubulin suppressor-like RCC1 family protein
VESGQRFACARTQAGDVWCWGQNNAGQLGVGDTTTRTAPAQVPLPALAVSIEAGFQAACAVLTDGSLWCWGDNYEGQMGQSDTFPGANEPDPLQVPGSYSAVAVGQGHHCAIRPPGELWCMGRNSEDELGQGPTAAIQLRAPTRVGTDSDWTQVTAGQSYTCGVRAGSVWCWGDNVAGQLGVGDQVARDVPTRVGTGQDWLAVHGNTFHTCGLRAPGTLWCWGRNVEGQLGLGDTTRRLVPVQVGTATDWVELSLGRFHTCARRSDGSTWCAGQNAEGRLGTGDQNQHVSLTPVIEP